MISFIKFSLIFSTLLAQVAFAVQTIDSESGLIIDNGYKVVKQHCSSCHSLKIVTQSQATHQGWLNTMRWMQKQQGMSALNKQTEEQILNYLSKNYVPNKRNRRVPLIIEKWKKY